mgnify:CR=1 FL=1
MEVRDGDAGWRYRKEVQDGDTGYCNRILEPFSGNNKTVHRTATVEGRGSKGCDGAVLGRADGEGEKGAEEILKER